MFCRAVAGVIRTQRRTLHRIGPPAIALQRQLTATTTSSSETITCGHDPASGVLDGSAKINDLSIQELKAALEFRSVGYEDCLEADSLRKRLAKELVAEYRRSATNRSLERKKKFCEGPSYGMLPRVACAISTELCGYDKEVYVSVPMWDIARVHYHKASNEYSSSMIEYLVHSKREIIVSHFNRERSIPTKHSPEEISDVAHAAIVCYYFGNKKAGVHDVQETQLGGGSAVERKAPPTFHHIPIFLDSPVPKGWTLPLEALEPVPSPQDRAQMLEAIEDARKGLGETCSFADSIIF